MRLPMAMALMAWGLAGAGVGAQEASAVRETRCWLGSVTFSSGALVNTGNGVSVCESDAGWRPRDEPAEAAGCLLEGELSSVGAVVGISNNDRMWLSCGSDGRWSTIVADDEPTVEG